MLVADAMVPSVESLPVIDLAPWESDDAGKRLVASQIRFACLNSGFFYIKNHGIPTSVIERTFLAAHNFFQQPEEVKLRVHYEGTNFLRGYIPLRGEGKSHGGDLKEAFDCAPEYPLPHHSDFSGTQSVPSYWERMYARNPWPASPEDFQGTIESYLESCVHLGRTLFAIFAVSLGLPQSYFEDKLDQPVAEVRLLRYPSQEIQDNTPSIGIDAHCDSESFTILAQSEVGGIQVKNKDGLWLLAPSLPGTFLITVGDMLARWTNDVYTPTPHRVIHVAEQERYSLPFFFGPDFNTTITCLETCQSSERPAHYKPVVAGDYLVRRLKGDFMDQTRTI